MLAPLIAVLGLVTAVLLVALTRSQVTARKARRDSVVRCNGEGNAAQLELQGRTAQREAQELALIDALFRATRASLALFDRDLSYVRINQGLSDIHGLLRVPT